MAAAMPSAVITVVGMRICAVLTMQADVVMHTPIADPTIGESLITVTFRRSITGQLIMAGPIIHGPLQSRMAGAGVVLRGTAHTATISRQRPFIPIRLCG